ncbi:hypothetical protein [Hoeflea sp.]|uniref:hypothetical protein n=1 Tax=Hoeflea sp. TaxID=1940281 RepID=UPI003B521FB9
MVYINSDFLASGDRWNSSEIVDLQFNFASTTPSHWFSRSEFQSEFDISDTGNSFSDYNSSVNNISQKAVVRFLLLQPNQLSGFSGTDTIHTALVNIANRALPGGGTENFRV